MDEGLYTLSNYSNIRKYASENGENGGKKRFTGKDGKDLVLKVPPGTLIIEKESGKIVADMSGDNRRMVILKGGRGGKGNWHYATSTMQVPKYAPDNPAWR